MTGTVKWFSEAKGYGFIAPDDGGADVFAHQTAVQMAGHRYLTPKQRVEFEVAVDGGRSKAVAVRPLEPPDEARRQRDPRDDPQPGWDEYEGRPHRCPHCRCRPS